MGYQKEHYGDKTINIFPFFIRMCIWYILYSTLLIHDMKKSYDKVINYFCSEDYILSWLLLDTIMDNFISLYGKALSTYFFFTLSHE